MSQLVRLRGNQTAQTAHCVVQWRCPELEWEGWLPLARYISTEALFYLPLNFTTIRCSLPRPTQIFPTHTQSIPLIAHGATSIVDGIFLQPSLSFSWWPHITVMSLSPQKRGRNSDKWVHLRLTPWPACTLQTPPQPPCRRKRKREGTPCKSNMFHCCLIWSKCLRECLPLCQKAMHVCRIGCSQKRKSS